MSGPTFLREANKDFGTHISWLRFISFACDRYFTRLVEQSIAQLGSLPFTDTSATIGQRYSYRVLVREAALCPRAFDRT